jgi:hypothetical protein
VGVWVVSLDVNFFFNIKLKPFMSMRFKISFASVQFLLFFRHTDQNLWRNENSGRSLGMAGKC